MDINLLVVNVGNTRVSLGIFVGRRTEAGPPRGFDDRAILPGIIEEFWSEIADTEGNRRSPGPRLIPRSSRAIEHIVREATGARGAMGRQAHRPPDRRADREARTDRHRSRTQYRGRL